MILSDGSIEEAVHLGTLGIEPFVPPAQPASYDIHLAAGVKRFKSAGLYIDPMDPPPDDEIWEPFVLPPEGWYLPPHEGVLFATVERFRIPSDIAAKVEGKSSLGRWFLVIHATAGWVDPGFSGTLTLELINWSPHFLLLKPGRKIGQISFHKMDKPVHRPYGSAGLNSRYVGQSEPTPSRLHHFAPTQGPAPLD